MITTDGEVHDYMHLIQAKFQYGSFLPSPSSATLFHYRSQTDTDRGTRQCGPGVGSQDHEEIDAQTFADWQIDYLKEDSCSASSDENTAFEQYVFWSHTQRANIC